VKTTFFKGQAGWERCRLRDGTDAAFLLRLPDVLAAKGELGRARRREIAEQEYRRCGERGQRALDRGQPVGR